MRVYIANSGDYDGITLSTNMLIDSRIMIHERYKNTLLWGLLKSNFPKGSSQDYVNAIRNNQDDLLGAIKSLERFR